MNSDSQRVVLRIGLDTSPTLRQGRFQPKYGGTRPFLSSNRVSPPVHFNAAQSNGMCHPRDMGVVAFKAERVAGSIIVVSYSQAHPTNRQLS